jgi:DNA repair exonuclease SbcCD nuclease subunit
VKLLHFSDLHLDTPFRWASSEVARARRQALRETLLRICRLAGELSVDALTCGGDLYEQERFTPDTAEFLRCTFADLHPLPVLVAPGNHDWFGPESLYRQVEWSPNVRILDAPNLAPVTLAEGVTLWGAGHHAPANTPDLLDDFHVDRSGVHLALFHGSAQSELAFQEQGKVPHAPFRPEQIAQAGLHHALLGHFHAPRDAPDYTYPGNPDPLSFGESGGRAAVLLTVAGDGSLTRERHVVATSLVSDVVVDLTGVTHSGQVRERVADAVAELSGVVRVTLTGEIGPDVDLRPVDLATVGRPRLDSVVVRLGRINVAYDVDRLREEPTVRGAFVRDVLAADLGHDERRRVLVTGLRALDGRTGELDVH